MRLVLKWQGYREFCVICVLEIGGALSQVSIYQDFECIKNLNILGFLRVYLQGS